MGRDWKRAIFSHNFRKHLFYGLGSPWEIYPFFKKKLCLVAFVFAEGIRKDRIDRLSVGGLAQSFRFGGCFKWSFDDNIFSMGAKAKRNSKTIFGGVGNRV